LVKPVFLFNGGKFPRETKKESERSKMGLMLNVQEDKIMEIKFCFVFLKTENKYLFECIAEKIKSLIAGRFSI